MYFYYIAAATIILFVLHYISYILNYILTENNCNKKQQTIDVNNKNIKQLKSTMQASDDARFIKKCWRGGNVEPHPTDKALIVNYELEATVFGEPNNPMLEEKKKCQKIIRLKSLNANTDPAILAREVINKCDLIHRSQLPDVEQIIFYLKNRKDKDFEVMENNNSKQTRSGLATQRRGFAKRAATANVVSSTSSSIMNTSMTVNKIAATEVSINNVEDYIELLYEDLNERISGSSMILQVARNPDNLEELEKNEACLSALSRVLREDWRKSLDLSTNIIYIFFCFSTYTKFHNVIVQYKIGSLCMDVIDYELRRYETLRQELDNRKNPNANMNSMSEKSSRTMLNNSSEEFNDIMHEERPKEMEPPRRRIPELKQRPKSGNWASYHGSMSSSLIKSQILNNSYHEALSNSVRMESNLASARAASNEQLDDPKLKKDEIDRLNKQLKIFAKKQEQLLRVAFYLLLNMAENIKLEEKMRRKNIIKMLVKALDRQNIDLLMLVTTFLKKLSIVGQNKDTMSELNVINKLPRLFQSNHNDLVQVTLKLVFNLSFDGNVRRKMLAAGYLPILVQFVNDTQHHNIAVRILYHMSLDDQVKAMFAHTECVQLAVDAMLLNLSAQVDMQLLALCINLALNKRNAQIMTEGMRLRNLMERAFKYRDALIMKLIRNISQHETLQPMFIDYVGDLAQVIKEFDSNKSSHDTKNDDEMFALECIGILGNLCLPDLDYSQLLQNFELIPWLREALKPGARLDDVVLDIIVFLGTCASDELCALLLCRAEMVISLIELLRAKQEDDEIVLQIIYMFQQVLNHESTREYMIRETEAPAYLIDLMHDKNVQIRKICDYCLDVIAITDSDWAKRIKLEKFRNHNSQWLCMVESQQDHDQDYGADEEDEQTQHLMENFLRDGYLDHPELFSGNEEEDEEREEEEEEQYHDANSGGQQQKDTTENRQSPDDEFYQMTSSSKSQNSLAHSEMDKGNKINMELITC